MNFRVSKCVFFLEENNNVIAYNNLNFKIIQMDKEFYNKLKNYNSNIVFEERDFKYLIENKFLVEEAYDEINFREKIKNKIKGNYARKESNISYIRISLTENCNLRCKYCFVNEIMSEKSNISKENFIKAINYLIDNNDNKNKVRVQYFGGEPLLRMELIKLGHGLLTEAKKNQKIQEFEEEIVTNGTLLDEEKIGFFIDNKISLIFSIDGWKEINDINRVDIHGNGTFNAVSKNMKNFIEKGGSAEVIITPNEDNLYYLDEIVEFLVNNFCINQISINAPQPNETGWKIDGEILAQKIIKIYELGEKRGILLSIPGMNIIHNLLNKKYQIFSCSNYGCELQRSWGIYVFSTGEVSYCLVERMLDLNLSIEQTIPRAEIDEWHMQVTQDDICKKCIAYTTCGGMCSMEKQLIFDEKIRNNKCTFVREILKWGLKR